MRSRADGRSFDELVQEAERVPIHGWDFGWLEGRAIEERPSWHYFDLVAARTPAVRSLLDLQVGSGGMIAALPVVPERTVGTEGYGPNVRHAARNLASRDAQLVWTDESRPALPFASQSFELVTSRHPVDTWWEEIARVLVPGGTYLSQQVGPHTVRELAEAMLGPLPDSSKRDPNLAREAAELAGLIVSDLREERPLTQFYDVGAVVYFLRLVVWIVPGFTVSQYLQQLRRVHEQIERDGAFVTSASRFLIETVKP